MATERYMLVERRNGWLVWDRVHWTPVGPLKTLEAAESDVEERNSEA